MSKKIFVVFVIMVSNFALGNDEISLFDIHRKATAYIAKDLTIYLWSGKPVAYLYPDSSDGEFHIYGFNGEHLGWLVKGIFYDNSGKVFCAFRKVFSGAVAVKSVKSVKQVKSSKYVRRSAPSRPFLSNIWSDVSCDIHLT